MSRVDSSLYFHPMSRSRGSARIPAFEATLVVVEGGSSRSDAIREICAFLEIHIVSVSGDTDLRVVLREHRPMALLASMDGETQDGGYVMKTVADYDPDLPILMLTDGDAALAGAADAVEEIFGLSSVIKTNGLPNPREFVDFLCRAGQRGHCLGAMPI